VDNNYAVLEMKYGNIYGGFPNFFAVAEISLLVFEMRSQKIFIETWRNGVDVDYVSVYSQVNELGHTIGRTKEVVNMRTGRVRPFLEDYKLEERALQYSFKQLQPSGNWIRSFATNAFRKYRLSTLITFDGRRDVFLLERAGVRFNGMNIVDLQKELNKETDYLFSLNKLAKIINYDLDGSYLRSNNLEYWLHPIAAKQIVPGTAGFDAARLLMIHNEYREHHPDFMVKAQLLLNKLQNMKEDEPAPPPPSTCRGRSRSFE